MVCVGGEAISDGGCGESDYKGTSKITTSTGGTIEIIQDSCPGDADCGKVFLFIDENDDHKFDSGDTVYEVKGMTGGGSSGIIVTRRRSDTAPVCCGGGCGPNTGTVNCDVDIPEGYAVIYAQKECGGFGSSVDYSDCANDISAGCSRVNVDEVGPITISNNCTDSCPGPHFVCSCGSITCGTFAITIQTN